MMIDDDRNHSRQRNRLQERPSGCTAEAGSSAFGQRSLGYLGFRSWVIFVATLTGFFSPWESMVLLSQGDEQEAIKQALIAKKYCKAIEDPTAAAARFSHV